jgi:hypothetical protein
MTIQNTYKCFISYSHHDDLTDSFLMGIFTKELENRVNAKLVNARFEVWWDKEGLRTGDKWDSKIEAEIRLSNILIVLLSPRWIHSNYTRKEYSIFEEVERLHDSGDCVVPILIRPMGNQESYFTLDQENSYKSITSRQYMNANVVDLLKLDTLGLAVVIEKLADDIEGVIERLRQITKRNFQVTSYLSTSSKIRPNREFKKLLTTII